MAYEIKRIDPAHPLNEALWSLEIGDSVRVPLKVTTTTNPPADAMWLDDVNAYVMRVEHSTRCMFKTNTRGPFAVIWRIA